MSEHCAEPERGKIEALGLTGLKMFQPGEGYRFSLDPILLCGFAVSSSNANVVDLGTGNGVIPLLLSRHITSGRIVGVERQLTMVRRARGSVEMNGLQKQITIQHADIRSLVETFEAETFDAVFANPPYRACRTGRVARNEERAAARHELAGDVADFIRVGTFLLKQGGRFNIVFLAERLVELLSAMRNFGVEPKRLRMVHSRQNIDARLVLIEGRKNTRPGLQVEPPLIIYEKTGRNYSQEVLEMYGETRDAERGTRVEKS